MIRPLCSYDSCTYSLSLLEITLFLYDSLLLSMNITTIQWILLNSLTDWLVFIEDSLYLISLSMNILGSEYYFIWILLISLVIDHDIQWILLELDVISYGLYSFISDLYEFLVKYYDFTWIPLSFLMYFLCITKIY